MKEDGDGFYQSTSETMGTRGIACRKFAENSGDTVLSTALCVFSTRQDRDFTWLIGLTSLHGSTGGK